MLRLSSTGPWAVLFRFPLANVVDLLNTCYFFCFLEEGGVKTLQVADCSVVILLSDLWCGKFFNSPVYFIAFVYFCNSKPEVLLPSLSTTASNKVSGFRSGHSPCEIWPSKVIYCVCDFKCCTHCSQSRGSLVCHTSMFLSLCPIGTQLSAGHESHTQNQWDVVDLQKKTTSINLLAWSVYIDFINITKIYL